MSLEHIEELCRAAKLGYTKREDGLLVKIEVSQSIGFPILLSPKENGFLQAFMWFPKNKSPTIEDLDNFCTALNDTFKPDAQFGYQPDRNQFWAGLILKENDLGKGIDIFSGACEFVYPLILHVGSLGSWSHQLLNLASLSAEDMSQA